ncbi:50S ribosomal protein L23 [candidate division KSB1 bacterium]|nr:50S ribosomal protein L23 [candidate division KSB1 bacterium]MCH8287146.1 50S ribosomal protein L23 [candidate division KSB1 bacterium]
MNSLNIIIRPLVTEKLTNLSESANQYGFVVDRRANKIEIKQAVEKKFEVRVKSVRTINVRGKMKTLGRFTGRRSSWKKAVITLEKGHTIALFEGA